MIDRSPRRSMAWAWRERLLPGFLLLSLAGCNRSHVAPPLPESQVEPQVEVKELPRQKDLVPPPPKRREAKRSEQGAPRNGWPAWYLELAREGSGEKTGVKPPAPTGAQAGPGGGSTLVEVIDLDDAAAVSAYWNPILQQEPATPKGLLAEVHQAVLAQRPADARWSVYSMELGLREPDLPGSLLLTTVIVLRNLYLRRSEVAIENLQLEACMTFLAKQAGMRHAQTRAHNPLVNWRKQNVSTVEALAEITAQHGFEYRLTGTHRRIRTPLQPQKIQTRAEFVKKAVDQVLAEASGLERDLPALLVFPRSKEKQAQGERAKGEGGGEEEGQQPVAGPEATQGYRGPPGAQPESSRHHK